MYLFVALETLENKKEENVYHAALFENHQEKKKTELFPVLI